VCKISQCYQYLRKTYIKYLNGGNNTFELNLQIHLSLAFYSDVVVMTGGLTTFIKIVR